WGVRSLIVRAGDYFGPNAKSSWFANCMVKAGKRPSYVLYPGRPEIAHNFAYLPDLAETMARLIACEDRLAAFDVYHFGGHQLAQGGDIARSIGRALSRPDLPIRRLPWAIIGLAAPFNPTFYEMLELRYLWREPIALDNRKLIAAIGAEPHTPLDCAVTETL